MPIQFNVKGKCTIQFEDGTSKELDLGNMCTEIDISPELKQSINIESTKSERFRLAYTKPLMDGKKWNKIIIEKQN